MPSNPMHSHSLRATPKRARPPRGDHIAPSRTATSHTCLSSILIHRARALPRPIPPLTRGRWACGGPTLRVSRIIDPLTNAFATVPNERSRNVSAHHVSDGAVEQLADEGFPAEECKAGALSQPVELGGGAEPAGWPVQPTARSAVSCTILPENWAAAATAASLFTAKAFSCHSLGVQSCPLGIAFRASVNSANKCPRSLVPAWCAAL